MSRIFLTLLLLLQSACAWSSAQQAPPPNNGQTQLFRGLLHHREFAPETLAATQADNYDFGNLVVIVLGDSGNVEVQKLIRTTLSRGGGVLIAQSTRAEVGGYFPSACVVNLRPIAPIWNDAANSGPLEVVQPTLIERNISPVVEFELFENLLNVETGPGAALELRPMPKELQRVIARYPAENVEPINGRPQPTKLRTFAVAGHGVGRNPYRCAVMGSEALFDNASLYTASRQQNPTDNFTLADNVVRWLKGPQARTKCVFIERGVVSTKFDEIDFSNIPMDDLPPPALPEFDPFDRELQQKLSEAGNGLIAEIQAKDFIGQALRNNPDALPRLLLSIAAILAVLAYVVYRARAVLGNNHKPDYRPLPRDPQQLGADVVPGSLAHRRIEILRSSNYAPAVKEYLQRLFEERGLPSSATGAKPPPVVYKLKNSKFLKEAMANAWGVLQSTKPMNYGQWLALEPYLQALQASARDDRWTFAPTGPEANRGNA